MNPSPAPLQDWLRLWRLVQQSSASVHKLLCVYDGPAAALQATAADWRRAGVAPEKAARLQRWRAGELMQEMQAGLQADMDWCAQPGCALLTLHDDNYPALLREIADPPPLLFLRGNTGLLNLPQLAIVGSRRPSLTGQADAAAFAAELATAGLVITSGLARGVDAAAHAGALRAGGHTVAVLGCGADLPYPRENRALYQALLEKDGLVVSEFLPGTPPLPLHFPRRNRVISGLSVGVLVVEAAVKSGSLITARLAADQGRLVWALPGSRHQPESQGCLRLIRDGVTAVTDSRQILGDLPALLGFLRSQLPPPSASTVPVLASLPGEARTLLEALGSECRHADWLITMTGVPAAAVLRALAALEAAGLIAAVPGGYERLR